MSKINKNELLGNDRIFYLYTFLLFSDNSTEEIRAPMKVKTDKSFYLYNKKRTIFLYKKKCISLAGTVS